MSVVYHGREFKMDVTHPLRRSACTRWARHRGNPCAYGRANRKRCRPWGEHWGTPCSSGPPGYSDGKLPREPCEGWGSRNCCVCYRSQPWCRVVREYIDLPLLTAVEATAVVATGGAGRITGAIASRVAKTARVTETITTRSGDRSVVPGSARILVAPRHLVGCSERTEKNQQD